MANHGHATATELLTRLTVVHTQYNFSVYGYYNGKQFQQLKRKT